MASVLVPAGKLISASKRLPGNMRAGRSPAPANPTLTLPGSSSVPATRVSPPPPSVAIWFMLLWVAVMAVAVLPAAALCMEE